MSVENDPMRGIRVPTIGSGWVKLFGALMIIGGVIFAVVLIGIPYIFAGIHLFRAGEFAEQYGRTGDLRHAGMSVSEFVRYFRLVGIAGLVTLFLVLFLALIVSIIMLIGY